MTTVVGFIGLGTMGAPMAQCLVGAGFQVRGFDLEREKVSAFEAASGIGCRSIAEACSGADIVITILPRDEHVRAALIGKEGVSSHVRPNTLILEMSTITPAISVQIAKEMQDLGLRMMDAPVGRTPADARTGSLLVMAGGDPTDFQDALPVFDALADKVLHMGPLGSGIRMKIANNYMSMVSMVLTAETLTMAKKAGIDTKAAVEVLQNTVAGRGQINVNYPKKVLAGDITPDFPLSMGHKDLSLAMKLGQELQVPLFLGASAQELFGLAPSLNRADQDCTAMLLILEQLAGITEGGAVKRG